MIDTTFEVIENEQQRNELAEFYSKNKNKLYYIALSKLNNIADAEDAVQEVFSEIADKPEKFFAVPPENRIAYTGVMVRNIAVDMFNEKNKIPLDELNEDIENDTVSLNNSLFDRIARDEILSFIDTLPTLQRSDLTLHCLFGLPIDETARRLNISITAANKRLTLARKAIKAFIEKRSNDHE